MWFICTGLNTVIVLRSREKNNVPFGEVVLFETNSGEDHSWWECNPTIWTHYRVYVPSLSKKKKTSHDHVCFVLWDARSCYVCTRFCTCQSTSVLQRSKTKHHIFFILLLLFYCSSPTEEANEQTKHSHIVCSDTFWLDVHHSHRSPKTLELTPLNLRSVHSWISFLKVKTNVFKPCFKETFCFSIIFIVKLFIN